jgi:hypothetical protein
MSPTRKNKIILSDYNYRRDIENRHLMAEISLFEVDMLSEIINGSLKITVEQLADTLKVPKKTLLPILQKFSKTKLYQIQADQNIIVDKEMRKYFESQLEIFDETFEPGMEFLQCLLNKVPIHSLPAWYSIPRTSDNIFSSLVEKYMLTPKVFERYLSELVFDEPFLKDIMKDVYSAPDFILQSRFLMEKYSLTREQLEECLLLLEYNFVCCLSYRRIDDKWVEVVTPFAEWREHLRFVQQTMPKTITNVQEIVRWHKEDFGYIIDLNSLLQLVIKKPLSVKLVDGFYVLDSKDKAALESAVGNANMDSNYLSRLIEKQEILNLSGVEDGKLVVKADGGVWLKKSLPDQALTMYRLPLLCLPMSAFSDRDVREAEKSLKRVMNCGWIYFDDFMKGFISSVGENAEQVLIKRGKRWRYSLPEYSDTDKAVIKGTILERLYAIGMVAGGEHNGRVCFCLTPFGKMSLGD